MNKTIVFIVAVFIHVSLIQGQRVNKHLIKSRTRYLKNTAVERGCVDQKDSLNCLFIYIGEFKKHKANELLTDKAFFDNISLAFNNGWIFNLFRKRTSKRPSYMAILYKKSDQIVARASLNRFSCFKGGLIYNEYKALIDFYLRYKPGIIMVINGTGWDVYFAEVEGKLKILLFDEGECKEIGLEELKKNWGDIFAPGI